MEVNKNFIMLLAYLCLSHILTNIRGYGVLYMLDISEVGSGSYQLTGKGFGRLSLWSYLKIVFISNIYERAIWDGV